MLVLLDLDNEFLKNVVASLYSTNIEFTKHNLNPRCHMCPSQPNPQQLGTVAGLANYPLALL